MTTEAGGIALLCAVVVCALLGIPKRLAVGIYLGLVALRLGGGL